MGHKLPVIKKEKSCKRRGRILCILSGLDMYGMKLRIPVFCHALQYRYILRRKRTLFCVIQYKSLWHIFLPMHGIPKTGKRNTILKRQIHKLKIRFCCVLYLKSLIAYIIRVRDESLFLFRGQGNKRLFSLRFTVLNTRIQQKVRVSISFKLPGYPQAVNVYTAFRLDGYPCVFHRVYSMKHFPRTFPFKNTSPSSNLSLSQFFFDMT